MNIYQSLEQILLTLEPEYLQITNESANHAGYFEGKESHFKVVIVSAQFTGLRQVQRHQKIYSLVGDLLQPSKIHALAIHAYLPEEWHGDYPNSPNCAHAPH